MADRHVAVLEHDAPVEAVCAEPAERHLEGDLLQRALGGLEVLVAALREEDLDRQLDPTVAAEHQRLADKQADVVPRHAVPRCQRRVERRHVDAPLVRHAVRALRDRRRLLPRRPVVEPLLEDRGEEGGLRVRARERVVVGPQRLPLSGGELGADLAHHPEELRQCRLLLGGHRPVLEAELD